MERKHDGNLHFTLPRRAKSPILHFRRHQLELEEEEGEIWLVDGGCGIEGIEGVVGGDRVGGNEGGETGDILMD